MASKRETDTNGFWLIRGNPISKVGVFPYLGKELQPTADVPLEPEKIYYVYRSAESLSDPETGASFLGVPFVDDHTWLGKDGEDPEGVGVQGAVVSEAYFDAPYLRSDIKLFSKRAMELIQDKTKIQLSPAYKSKYRWDPGTFEGQPYQLVQYNMRGNHLALVKEGRTGPDVAVMDQHPFTFDSMEFVKMEFTPEQLAAIKAMMKEMLDEALAAAKTADQDPNDPTKKTTDQDPDDPTKKTTDQDPPVVTAEAAEVAAVEATKAAEHVAEVAEELAEAVAEIEAATDAVELAVVEGATTDAMPAAVKRLTAARAKLAKVRAKQRQGTQDGAVAELRAELRRMKADLAAANGRTLDAASLAAQIHERDRLADELSHHVGTFDHMPMGLQAVAEYGAKKLGLSAAKGQELTAVRAYLSGVKKASARPGTHDSAPVQSNTLNGRWAKQSN